MKKTLLISLSLAVMLAMVPHVYAVKIADITRISGQRTNVLTGLGLVVGLNGTGDGGDFAAARNPLVSMLKQFSDPVTAAELGNAQNTAIVVLSATVPGDGVRQGDPIDLYVASVGKSSSLRGGRLFVTPMTGPVPGGDVFAMAQGPITIEDTGNPRVGVIRGGVVMEVDLPATYYDNTGRFTLILEESSASWTTASTIAKIINDAESTTGEILAVAVDPKNVVVTIPPIERDRPDSFISRVQRLPVPMLPTEARVQINEKTGTMIVTGDVEISPVVIVHGTLSINIVAPTPVPTPRNPVMTTKDVIALDTGGAGGAKLQDLVDALDRIRVPAADRITIIKELHKTGKLHAKLKSE